MRDYLFVYPTLRPVGGAEFTAAWMLQCLLERGNVTAVTIDRPDLEALERASGTALTRSALQVVQARWYFSAHLERLGQPHQLWQLRYFIRQARRLRGRYRFCISAFNDLDLGPDVAFQYLQTAPRNHESEIQLKNYVRSPNLWKNQALALYRGLCDWLAPWDERRIRANWTAANSIYTGQEFTKVYQRNPERVLFPPPVGVSLPRAAAPRPWFLSLARANADKGWDDAIEIVSRLRLLGHDVGLSAYIIPDQQSQLDLIQALADRHPEWLEVHINAPRSAIEAAIASHKFGLHTSHEESYGMAIAEMVLGGCLTAVRNQGGQTEIVKESELQFRTVDEAVQKLNRVLRSPALESRLLASQQNRKDLYTREHFCQAFHACLDDYEQMQKSETTLPFFDGTLRGRT